MVTTQCRSLQHRMMAHRPEPCASVDNTLVLSAPSKCCDNMSHIGGEPYSYYLRTGGAFLISRSVLGPAPQRWRAGGGKQKQKQRGGPGARASNLEIHPSLPLVWYSG